jgi:hypothetical protein
MCRRQPLDHPSRPSPPRHRCRARARAAHRVAGPGERQACACVSSEPRLQQVGGPAPKTCLLPRRLRHPRARALGKAGGGVHERRNPVEARATIDACSGGVQHARLQCVDVGHERAAGPPRLFRDTGPYCVPGLRGLDGRVRTLTAQ